MKKKNKILAVILVIAIITSLLIVGTMANTKTTSISISVDKAELVVGETATVTVKATTNYPVATASIPVFYDKTLVSVSGATATMTGYDNANVTTDSNAVDTTNIYNNTVDSSKYGFVLVNYIGGANDSVAESLTDVTVLTFTITALADVSGEAMVKCVTESAKTEENVAGMLYFGTTTSGTIITSIPENVENVDVTAATTSVVITSGNAELVAIADTTAVVDTTNKYVYGITPGDNIENYFTVNNGTYELVASSAGVSNGTGAQIQVKNTNGEVVDTYTVIIFGDVNGDGGIKAADELAVQTYVAANGGTTFSDDADENIIRAFAGDVNGDGSIKAADQLAVQTYVAANGNTSAISVNTRTRN